MTQSVREWWRELWKQPNRRDAVYPAIEKVVQMRLRKHYGHAVDWEVDYAHDVYATLLGRPWFWEKGPDESYNYLVKMVYLSVTRGERSVTRYYRSGISLGALDLERELSNPLEEVEEAFDVEVVKSEGIRSAGVDDERVREFVEKICSGDPPGQAMKEALKDADGTEKEWLRFRIERAEVAIRNAALYVSSRRARRLFRELAFS